MEAETSPAESREGLERPLEDEDIVDSVLEPELFSQPENGMAMGATSRPRSIPVRVAKRRRWKPVPENLDEREELRRCLRAELKPQSQKTYHDIWKSFNDYAFKRRDNLGTAAEVAPVPIKVTCRGAFEYLKSLEQKKPSWNVLDKAIKALQWKISHYPGGDLVARPKLRSLEGVRQMLNRAHREADSRRKARYEDRQKNVNLRLTVKQKQRINADGEKETC
jgi:hypothetical protein